VALQWHQIGNKYDRRTGGIPIMDLNLKGKYALVTGSSHGIGRSIALALADEGCNVAICARNKERIKEIIVEIKAKGIRKHRCNRRCVDPRRH